MKKTKTFCFRVCDCRDSKKEKEKKPKVAENSTERLSIVFHELNIVRRKIYK